jgi:hypothetical protein
MNQLIILIEVPLTVVIKVLPEEKKVSTWQVVGD